MPNPLARANRRRMTDAEMRLWFRLRPLRNAGLAFRRQSPIGAYIIDFECRRAKLCIEVDGAQHGMRIAAERDAERTTWLQAHGYKVLRFWNQDVLKHTDLVIDEIIQTAQARARELRG